MTLPRSCLCSIKGLTALTSARALSTQVGPDDLRTNALLQLLVHMSKRDAFNILRTQQQVGCSPMGGIGGGVQSYASLLAKQLTGCSVCWSGLLGLNANQT